MSAYYISACHDCKNKSNWGSVFEEVANIYHNEYRMEKHNYCNLELGSDYDDEFYASISNYVND